MIQIDNINPLIRWSWPCRAWPCRAAQPGCGKVRGWPQCSAACSVWGAAGRAPENLKLAAELT